MEHTKHLWRAFSLLVLAAMAGIVGRHFLVPDSFGVTGPFRYEALAETASKPVIHGSLAGCLDCHGEIGDVHAEGGHQTVACEVCHAPLTSHVREEEKIADMPTDNSPALCLGCHQELGARPEDMPQIDMDEHLSALEVAVEPGEPLDGLCLTCHDVHDPSF